ncbi:MAG TPA: hypothetical protein VF625_08235, partial [Longimicrobium sp.]
MELPQLFVIPAEAGIPLLLLVGAWATAWIPAFAGMTGGGGGCDEVPGAALVLWKGVLGFVQAVHFLVEPRPKGRALFTEHFGAALEPVFFMHRIERVGPRKGLAGFQAGTSVSVAQFYADTSIPCVLTGKRLQSSTTVGSTVCHRGIATGYSCGT